MRERNGSIELPTARASRQRARDYVSSQQHPDSHCSMEGQVPGNFFVRMSLAGIEPVGFRVKSDLRNHQAIVQPRLYDCLMVTQVTLESLALLPVAVRDVGTWAGPPTSAAAPADLLARPARPRGFKLLALGRKQEGPGPSDSPSRTPRHLVEPSVDSELELEKT